MEELKTTERICPECGKPYTGRPGLSRKDNKTEICGHCCGVQGFMFAGYTKEQAEEIQNRLEKGFEVTVHDGNGVVYTDNIEPLFSDMMIDSMTAGEAQRFTREKGAELTRAAVEYALRKNSELEGDELTHEVVRLAYIRGYKQGIRFVSTINLIPDFEPSEMDSEPDEEDAED